MKICEIIQETITPADIESVQRMRNINDARAETLRIMFANARDFNRRADLRAQVARAGTIAQLVQQLWSMKLSNEGNPTGIKTARTRRGIGYDV